MVCTDCKRNDLSESQMQEIDGKLYCPACASLHFMKIEQDNGQDMFFTKTGEDDDTRPRFEKTKPARRISNDLS